MASRPTTHWRANVAAGHEYAAELFPDALLTVTDETLDAFEARVVALGSGPSDAAVMATVRDVVLALNGINDDFDGAAYETDERERLCQYIDDTLTEGGVDVPALAARLGIHPAEITDEWREW